MENELFNEEEDLVVSSQDAGMSEDVSDEEIGFEDLGLDEITLAAIEKKGFVTPSPIQVLAIPRLLNGDANVIAKARTGTGKTAAFGLPLVQTLRKETGNVRAIILEPTRELAMQTSAEMASFSSGIYPRTCVVYGGASITDQMRSLRKGCEIVVGTPGRVQDLIDRNVLDISKIEYFILDEGDEMLDMGFVEDIEKIFSSANPECRVLLFSATIPSEILKIAQKFMGDYEIVEEEGHEEEPLLIDQQYWLVRGNERIEALIRIIDYSPDFYGIVFVQRKSDADMVSKVLDEKGYQAAALHGDIAQSQREKIIARFRSRKTRILVATDVAARGIDIEGLTHVVNYEMPFDGPTYVHRIGRTGRAGSSGIAITLVRPEEQRRLRYLQNAVKKSAKGEMVEGKIPTVEEVIDAKKTRLFDDIKQKLGLKSSSQVQDEDAMSVSDGDSDSMDSSMIKTDPLFEILAQELCEGRNPQDVVASLLSSAYGRELSKKRYGKISPVQSKSFGGSRDGGRRGGRDRGSRSSLAVGENEIRLYVQMGWIDKQTPKSIAEFFSKLLGIPGRKVDAIDMSDKFCLLTLPLDAGKRALELSERDKSLPHMHQDAKVEFSGRRDRFEGRDERRGRRGHGGERRDRFDRGERGGFGSKSRGSSHGRPRVHTSTKRNNQASLFKKKSGGEEY